MMLTQKKTCEGCRALSGKRCELGFKVRSDALQQWKAPVPLEPCPKPRTYDAWIVELERQRKAGTDATRDGHVTDRPLAS